MIREITAQEAFDEMKKNKKAKFIDVRSPEEFGFQHAHNSTNAPLESLKRIYENYAPREGTEDTVFYVICRRGRQSMEACDVLIKAGYKEAVSIKDGILGWQQHNLPVNGG